MDELLTEDEHRALDLTVELTNLVAQNIIGPGYTSQGDINEFVTDIHRIQNRIMAQAAARAYPDRYRLLGGTVLRKAGDLT